jgi:hypothetical protein
MLSYRDRFAQSTARQRLGKHVPTHTWPTIQQKTCFLCGPRHATVEEVCFLCGPRHATIKAVFSAWSVPRLYNRSL